MNPHKQLAIRALENMRGDDLVRARRAFSRYTATQMNMPYGQSTQTPAQILREYEKHDREINEAINWIRSL